MYPDFFPNSIFRDFGVHCDSSLVKQKDMQFRIPGELRYRPISSLFFHVSRNVESWSFLTRYNINDRVHSRLFSSDYRQIFHSSVTFGRQQLVDRERITNHNYLCKGNWPQPCLSFLRCLRTFLEHMRITVSDQNEKKWKETVKNSFKLWKWSRPNQLLCIGQFINSHFKIKITDRKLIIHVQKYSLEN